MIWIAQFKDADGANYFVNVDDLRYTKTVGNNTTIVFKDQSSIEVKGNVDEILEELTKVKTIKTN